MAIDRRIGLSHEPDFERSLPVCGDECSNKVGD